jgi:hypothetical protein
MLDGLLNRGFDFSFSNELKVDHSIICPIITTRPQADLPVVPIYTNIFAPPLQLPEVASAGGMDHASGLRATPRTLSPRCISSWTIASPMFRLAPVTMNTGDAADSEGI